MTPLHMVLQRSLPEWNKTWGQLDHDFQMLFQTVFNVILFVTILHTLKVVNYFSSGSDE